MKIRGSYFFRAPKEKLWEVLLNPSIIAQCIPGCEGLREIGPDRYEAVMKVGVAGLKRTCSGEIVIKDKRPFSHYVLSGKGSGSPGFMQGDIAIDLEETSGQTLVKFSTDAKVGGMIVSMGQDIASGVAKMMADQFFKKMERFL